MKITIDSKKGLKTNLKVFVDKKTIEGYMQEKYQELSKTVVLKGFRPGKVPIQLLKKQFGKSIYGEVLDKVLKETSTKAITDQKIKVSGQPKIDLKTYGEDKDLEYIIQIEELPKIEINELNKIQIKSYEIKVSDKDINKKIEEIAKNQNDFEDRKIEEKSQQGDLVIFDYEATIENKSFEGGQGKNTQIVLGKDLFIKGFDKQLIGCKKTKDIIVNVILPENYPKKEYSNKEAKFNCKILNIKKPIPVKINDSFAKNLGAKNLEDLNLLVSKQINDQYKQTLDTITKNEILEKLDNFKNIQIPENLIKQEIEILSHGMKDEDKKINKLKHEKNAKKRIKVGLILGEFGEQNKIEVKEEEIKNEIQKQIRMMPGQEKMVMDYYKKNPSAVDSLKGSIYEDKIINLIKNKSKLEKKLISIVEAENIIAEQNKKVDDENTLGEKSSKSNIQTSQKKDLKKNKKKPKNKAKIKKVSKK